MAKGLSPQTSGVHILIGIGAVLASVYTLSWAWTLGRQGNRAGAAWSVILAVSSSAVTLYYLFRHNFLP